MKKELKITFGINLKKARNEADLSMRKFAVLVGKSDTYLRQIEAGVASLPTEQTIIKIAQTLGVSSDQIMLSSGRLPKHIIDKILQNPELFEYNKEFVPF